MSKQTRERLVEKISWGIVAIGLSIILISMATYDSIAFLGAALFFVITFAVTWFIIKWIERG